MDLFGRGHALGRDLFGIHLSGKDLLGKFLCHQFLGKAVLVSLGLDIAGSLGGISAPNQADSQGNLKKINKKRSLHLQARLYRSSPCCRCCSPHRYPPDGVEQGDAVCSPRCPARCSPSARCRSSLSSPPRPGPARRRCWPGWGPPPRNCRQQNPALRPSAGLE